MIFDYKDPKEISAVSLTLDSPLEPIVGYAKGISGSVLFDPAHPERATGRVAVDVSSVQFANDGYTATARGYALDGKKWPQLFLAIRRIEKVRRVSATRYVGVVLAEFTCRGVTIPKRLAVTADYFPGRAEERTNGAVKGDLLVLRTHFTVSRKAHGISRGIPDALVGDAIEVGVAVVGIHPAAPAAPARAEVQARWEVELAGRDDPRLLRIEKRGERLAIRDGERELGATVTAETPKGIAFRLDPNAEYGEATGELDPEGRGVVRTKEGEVALRGRAVAAFATRPAPEPKGGGLPFLALARRMREAGTAGLAVARIERDGVAEVALYGVRRAGGDLPIEASTAFQAGTMGVPVLHLTALRLAASGRLDLERPANDYLGGEAIPDGPQGWGRRITVRDLMRSTSGFAFDKSGGDPPGAPDTLAKRLASAEIVREPGTMEGGSAFNEAYLERVVAHAAGRPAAEVATDEVLRPLGLIDSGYAARPANAADGHYSGGDPTLDGVHVYRDALGNGLWTSARDASRLVAEIGKLLGGRPNALLAEKDRGLLARIDAPQSILGIHRSEDRGMYLGGDPYGYFCEFFMRPEKGEAVVVLQNRMMGWRLTNDIVDAVRAPRAAPTPFETALPRLNGGAPLSLAAARGKGNLVTFFLNEQCGVTHAYRGRIERIVRDFGGKGFAFVGVRTGRKQFPDRPVVLPETAYLKMPFLDDADGALMRAYGIGQSLTFAVFDAKGALRYLGGVDDSVDAARVTRQPLRDALRSLATGRPVRSPRAPTYGCAILPVER